MGLVNQNVSYTTGNWELTISRDAKAYTLRVPLLNVDGTQQHTAEMYVYADGSKITDRRGNVVVSPVPASIMSDITDLLTRFSTAVDLAATNGKLPI